MYFTAGLVVLLTIAYTVAQDNCGSKPDQPPWVPELHIVGGRDAERGSWPWQISLQFSRNENFTDYGHTCGGVLIDTHWILCASHCVDVGIGGDHREDPSWFRVILGAHNFSNPTGDEQVAYLDKIIQHPKFAVDPTTGYPNDIALLRLSEPVDVSGPVIAKACLPMEQNFNFTSNENCWISGWGLVDFRDDEIPDTLQEANVEILSNDACQARHIGFIRDTHICAGLGYPNACSGDSGGPMSCLVDGKWYVAGVTSWGVAGCRGVPGVYTRVSKYWEWIVYTMNNN